MSFLTKFWSIHLLGFEGQSSGELEVGGPFPDIAASERLAVDYAVVAGSGWVPMCSGEGYSGQTQAAAADGEGRHIFNHPLDLHFFTASIAGWPRLHVQVLKLDRNGRMQTVSYGSVALPLAPGYQELHCGTWAPVSTTLRGRMSAACGFGSAHINVPRSALLDGRLPEVRSEMITRTSGAICLTMDTVLRNAHIHGILMTKT